jgi:hypothetical protein
MKCLHFLLVQKHPHAIGDIFSSYAVSFSKGVLYKCNPRLTRKMCSARNFGRYGKDALQTKNESEII